MSALNHAELLRRYAAHKAAAAACEAALKADALHEFVTHGTAVRWPALGIGTLAVSLSHDTVTITDEDKFFDWLEARYPTEVVVETVTVRRVISPAWQAAMLAGLLPVDPDEIGPGGSTQCMAAEGELVPGVVWQKGGKYLHAAITPDSGLKRTYALAAAAYVQGAPMPAVDPPGGAVAVAST